MIGILHLNGQCEKLTVTKGQREDLERTVENAKGGNKSFPCVS